VKCSDETPPAWFNASSRFCHAVVNEARGGPESMRWFWSIIVMGPARGRVRTDGRAATLEAAKADFAESWQAFKTAGQEPTAPTSLRCYRRVK